MSSPNLRNLLLQPPRARSSRSGDRSGFKNGCKLAALDEFGNVLGDGGHASRRQRRSAPEGPRARVVQLVKQHELVRHRHRQRHRLPRNRATVSTDLCERAATATFRLRHRQRSRRERFTRRARWPRRVARRRPARARAAISIGRRLLDPLSELVKINPANLGVGLYQHDVKGEASARSRSTRSSSRA